MNPNDELDSQGKRIREASNDVHSLHKMQEERSDYIDALASRIEELARGLGCQVNAPRADDAERPAVDPMLGDLVAAAGMLSEEHRRQLDDEYLRSVKAIPPMDDLDRFVIITVGCMAILADFLLVGVPPKTPWTPTIEGGKVPVGWLSARLKDLRPELGWLERLCRVPYDKSVFPGSDIGFSPVNHRVLSFGHDPSPFGYVFGLMDIASGRMSGTAYDGRVFNIDGVSPDWLRVCLAPLLWLGHLISDVATPMGLPLPGSSLFRILRIRVPYAPDDETISDVVRVLYQQGYDLRHYLAGGIVPGLIEGLIRLYVFLRGVDEAGEDPRALIRANLAGQQIARMRSSARLSSLLFYCHSIATTANAGKVALQGGATGDFFEAARAVNFAQWQMFALRSVQFIRATLRDKDLEHAVANRQRLEAAWEAFELSSGTAEVLYEPGIVENGFGERIIL